MRIHQAPNSTVAMSVVRGILHAAELIGLPSDKLCRAAGLDRVAAPEGRRVSGAQLANLWAAATRLSNDPFCGLHIGERTEPSSAHIVGHLLMNCATVGEAIERYSRYQRIVSNLLQVKLNHNRGYTTLTLQFLDPTVRYNRQMVEWIMAGEAALLRDLALKPIKPVKVVFSHPAPVDVAEYGRVFQAPIQFGQSENALMFSVTDMAAPIRNSDPELFSILDRQTNEYLKSLDRSSPYGNRVRRILVGLITDGRPNINKVAAELKMGTRSLQIKLREEETSYREILDDVRKQLALGYFQDHTMTVSAVSYLLGFSEPSVFHRAFQRWTGTTPGSYRNGVAARRSSLTF